jgi:hypothetical protein
MQLRKLKNISFFSGFSLLGLLFFIAGCVDFKKATVHNYPKEQEFVFENKIVINDALTKKTANELILNLSNYWDDSLKAKHIRQFGFFNTLIQPIFYQPERMERSILYMRNYLSSQGFHHPELTPVAKTDTINNEYRVKLTMQIDLGKKTLFDSVTYALGDSALQAIALQNKLNAYVKKGSFFSNDAINNELDRMVELFRANGYYFFTKEKIFAEVDTLNQELLQLNLDPLAQINQVQNAQHKEAENPSWKISFQLRNTDAKTKKAYPIGEQIFYSDITLSENPDSILITGLPNAIQSSNTILQFKQPKFSPFLFEEQAILAKGSPFNEKLFYQTLNNFSALGAWQQVDGRTTIHNDSVYLHYFLVPALRKSISLDLEGSRNTAQIGAGNLLGLSTSLTYRDRNVQKKSIPSITSFRTGIELNLNNNSQNLTQTFLLNIGHTYSFPKLILPFSEKTISANNSQKTNFTLNGSYIDRLNYYQLKSFTTNWGYEWKKNKNGGENIISYKPLNIELYQLTKFAKLDSLLLLNPFLRSSFNDGNVVGQTLNFIHSGPAPKKNNQQDYFRIGMEESGGLLGLIPSLRDHVYRFIKLETEWRKLIRFENTELAWRMMGGWGNNYSDNALLGGQLPFFKQFTAGGPYSMRAWGLRQLGLGSSRFYDTSSKSQNFDRFGDMQLEANLEYRFTLFQIGSYKIGSAFFTDMGNIWNTRDTKQDINAGFKLDRLYKDLAIAVGTGIRVDFNYFLIRIDYAMKMKDPTRAYNNGWLDFRNLKWTESKANGLNVNNYAWQFGIGLPF